MKYDTEKLTSDIEAVLVKAKTQTDEQMHNFAKEWAEAVQHFIKTALDSAVVKVIAMPGEILVVGTPATQNNASPIPLKGDPMTGGGLS